MGCLHGVIFNVSFVYINKLGMKLRIEQLFEMFDELQRMRDSFGDYLQASGCNKTIHPLRKNYVEYDRFLSTYPKEVSIDHIFIENPSSLLFAEYIVDNVWEFCINCILKHPVSKIFGNVLRYCDIKKNLYGFYLNIPYYKMAAPDGFTEEMWFNAIQTKDLQLYQHKGSITYVCGKIAQIISDRFNELDPEAMEVKNRIDEFKEKYATLYKQIGTDFDNKVAEKVGAFKTLFEGYTKEDVSSIEAYFTFLLEQSFYLFEFNKNVQSRYDARTQSLVLNYYLPLIEDIPDFNGFNRKGEVSILNETQKKKLYERVLYSLILRSIAEVFHYDEASKIGNIVFNGYIHIRNKATGRWDDLCIASIAVDRQKFQSIDLNFVNPQECFFYLKGQSHRVISELVAIEPILHIKKEDGRFISERNIAVATDFNLALMDWQDFEHLIRNLFDKEFNTSGGEVKITQSSRDGGVDAIAFDPDPIRGGKIIIQAKRYTNVVGVSAVRDLYGTIINEGANKGILITTSDFGMDSHKFAIGKPITLLNGANLLYLLKKHGIHATIDIQEARRLRDNVV